MRQLLLAILFLIVPAGAPTAFADPPWQVCFTPGGACTDLIVSEISGAKHQVLVQAYSFTSVPILAALKAAHARGVYVKVIVDKTSARQSKSGSSYSAATYLTNAGIPVWVDTKVAIAQSKVMVNNVTMVITGSFNFTAAAQKSNAENLLVLEDSALAEFSEGNWDKRRAASAPYAGPSRRPQC